MTMLLQRLQTALLMALVFNFYEDRWKDIGGGLAAIGICVLWTLFTLYIEEKDELPS